MVFNGFRLEHDNTIDSILLSAGIVLFFVIMSTVIQQIARVQMLGCSLKEEELPAKGSQWMFLNSQI